MQHFIETNGEVGNNISAALRGQFILFLFHMTSC